MPRAFIKSAYFKSITHVINHINYINKQSPIFGTQGDLPILAAIDNVGEHTQSQFWRQIFSLEKSDCERLAVDREYFKNLVAAKKAEMAQCYNISPNNLKVVASFHDKDHHPHLHLVMYSTDKREGFLKVHENADRKKILNKASTSLKSIFANEIFRDDTMEIKEMKDDLRTQLNEQIKNQVNSINSSAYPADKKLLLQIAALKDEVANASGRKVYGYLPPETKTKVDEIMQYIFANDKVCTELLSDYGKSQKSLIEVYADNKQTIRRKMSDWQQRFFSPKKGDDASRHNMIINAALQLDMVSSKEKTERVEQAAEEPVGSAHFAEPASPSYVAPPASTHPKPQPPVSVSVQPLVLGDTIRHDTTWLAEKSKAEYQAQRAMELVFRGKTTSDVRDFLVGCELVKKPNNPHDKGTLSNDDLLGLVKIIMDETPSVAQKVYALYGFYSQDMSFDDFLPGYLSGELEADMLPGIKRVVNYYLPHLRPDGTFDLNAIESGKQTRALRFELMKMIDSSFQQYSNSLLLNENNQAELKDFDSKLSVVATTTPKTITKNGKEITLPITYRGLADTEKSTINTLMQKLWKPEFDDAAHLLYKRMNLSNQLTFPQYLEVLQGKSTTELGKGKSTIELGTFLYNVVVKHALQYNENRNTTPEGHPRALQNLLYPEMEESEWQPRVKSVLEKRLEFQLKDVAHNFILQNPSMFAGTFSNIQSRLNLKDGNLSYWGQTDELRKAINDCVSLITASPNATFLTTQLYQENLAGGATVSYSDFCQNLVAHSPNYYNGLHSLIMEYATKATAENPICKDLVENEKAIHDKKMNFLVQCDNSICAMFSAASPQLNEIRERILESAVLKNSQPVFAYHKLPQGIKDLLNNATSDLLSSCENIGTALEEVRLLESPEQDMMSFRNSLINPIQGGNSQIQRLFLYHLEQQVKGEPIVPKYTHKTPYQYREKSKISVATNLLWSLARSVAAANRSAQANKPPAKAAVRNKKIRKRTHQLNREGDAREQ